MAHEEVLNLILRLGVHMFEAKTVPNMAVVGKHQPVLRTLDEIVAYVPGERCGCCGGWHKAKDVYIIEEYDEWINFGSAIVDIHDDDEWEEE